MRARKHVSRAAGFIVATGLAVAIVTGCGGSSGTSAGTRATTTGKGAPPAAGKAVLPVPKNPIANTATANGLTITKALVENNVSPETGKGVADHLEVALKNTSGKPLDQVEIYYEIVDKTKKTSEGYHATLDGFSIAPGKTRVAHFDNTGAADHFPVNKYSLYYTDKNELFVDVTASAPGVKPATFTVKKDSGGAEAGVE